MASRKLQKEVVLRFLSMLPVKSLLRFRSVCKEWCALIDSPSFIEKHLNHAATKKNNECILVKRFIEQESKSVLSFASKQTLDVVSSSTNIDVPFIDHEYIKLVGPINGIVCLDCGDVDLLLCNPATREFKPLPPCIDDYLPGLMVGQLAVGFGFDETSNDYKVVRIVLLSYGDDDWYYPTVHGVKAEIYSLSSDSWRKLDVTFPTGSFYSNSLTLFNGAFHWCAQSGDARIISFHMGSEVVEEVPVPASLQYEYEKVRSLAVLNNEYLALIRYEENQLENYFEIWVMKEYGVKESWSKQLIIGPLFGICKPVSFGKCNELLLLGDNGELVLCDIENTNRIRKFEAYGDQKHLDALLYVESLVSLKRLVCGG